MLKNYGLYAAVALFMLLPAGVKADLFDEMRKREDQVDPGSEKRSVAPGFVEVKTKGGGRRVEIEPVESLFAPGGIFGGGERYDHPKYDRGLKYNGRNQYDDEE